MTDATPLMPMPVALTPVQVSERLGASFNYLAQLREHRKGPPFNYAAREVAGFSVVRYPADGVETWTNRPQVSADTGATG